MDIAEIGRSHLRQALTGERHSCTVDEWVGDDGKAVTIYWKPLTGVEQKRIEAFKTSTERTCMTVKVRALDEVGKHIFADTPIESLMRDYDYWTILTIAYLMSTQDQPPAAAGEGLIEALEKE